MNTYTLGASPTLSGAFTDLEGNAYSPGTVTVKVRKPSGTITSYTTTTTPAVEIPTVGTATIRITLDQVGFWFYRFEGSDSVASPDESVLFVRESAFDTDGPDGGPYFGATIEGVAGRLPDRTFTDLTRPTEAQVGRFIIEIAARVSARIGAVETVADAGRKAALLTAAQGLVHLGAASMAEAAGAPEQADANAATSYAQWLHERFKEGLDELAATAKGLVPPDVPDDPSIGAGSPVWSFPNTLAYGRSTTSWESY